MSGRASGRADLLACVEGLRESILNDTMELIRIPSVSGDAAENARALAFLLDRGKSLGFESKTVLDGKVGIIEYGDGRETVGILVHVDVVPPGEVWKWTCDPFSGELQNGMIWGRGALDDKGPAIAALYAMKAVRDLGVPFHKKIQYIIGTGEESDRADMREYAEFEKAPDFGFTPDGQFPIGNLEFGVADAILKVPAGGEPARARMISALLPGMERGEIPEGASICMISGGKTMVVAGDRIKVRVSGWGGGGNAIVEYCRAMSAMEDVIPSLPPILGLIGMKDWSLDSEHEHASAVFLEIKDDDLLVSFHAQYANNVSGERIRCYFEWLAAQSGGEILHMSATPVMFVEKDKPFMKVLAEAYEAMSGLHHACVASGGGTYARVLPNIVSFGPLFPGSRDLGHRPDERIGTAHLMQLTRIYAEALRRIVSTSKSLRR